MKYCTATNTGTGFITSEDHTNFAIVGFTENLWGTDGSAAADEWVARVGGTPITVIQAQAIIDAFPPVTDEDGTVLPHITLS